MPRADFEGHILWAVVDNVFGRLDQLRSTSDPATIASADTIGFYADYVKSFKETSAVSSPFFVQAMLTPVETVLREVTNHLDNWIAQGAGSSYQESARITVESALLHLGPWPRPYGRGGQVQQLTTLYEDLLERQRLDLLNLQQGNATLQAEVEVYKTELAQTATASQGEVAGLVALAADAVATVNAEKVRVDEVVTAGVKQPAEMTVELDRRAKGWEESQLARFTEQVRPVLDSIRDHETQAVESLKRLKETEADFSNLTAAAATDKLAGHFAIEARNGRRAGTWLYIFGGLFIAAAAIPLLVLLIPGNLSSGPDTRWEQLAIRAGIGIASASAATVAIRLGGRFFSNANVAKRMELDLKTFGPFLANVGSVESDKARINLVERALGRSAEVRRESRDDSVTVGAMSHFLEAASKFVK